MKTNQLTEQLDTLKNIVERWDSCAAIPAIERDIVLEKLRSIYQHIQNPIMADENAENPLVAPEKPATELIEQQCSERGDSQGECYENSDDQDMQPEEESTDRQEGCEGSDCAEEKTTDRDCDNRDKEDDSPEIEDPGNQAQSDLEAECQGNTLSDQPAEEVVETQELFGQIVPKSLVEQFILDLFWRDEQFFVDEISKLGNQPSFESALIYISEKYNWRADSHVAQQFTEILADHNFRE